VKRVGNEFEIRFSFQSESEALDVVMTGVRDIENASELFEAERLWVEENETNQTEYGNLQLGISHECYTEICFDALS